MAEEVTGAVTVHRVAVTEEARVEAEDTEVAAVAAAVTEQGMSGIYLTSSAFVCQADRRKAHGVVQVKYPTHVLTYLSTHTHLITSQA